MIGILGRRSGPERRPTPLLRRLRIARRRSKIGRNATRVFWIAVGAFSILSAYITGASWGVALDAKLQQWHRWRRQFVL
jgi:hypothetical protein